LAFKPNIEEDLSEVAETVEIVKRMAKLPYRGKIYRIDNRDAAQKRSGKFTLYDDAEYGKGNLKAVGFAIKDVETGKLEIQI
jgi:hypothetical protein